MKNELSEVTFYNTYHYANFISNMLADQFDHIRILHELFEDDGYLQFITPFPKFSALHRFVSFCAELEFRDDLSSEYTRSSIQRGDPKLTINHAFGIYLIEHTSFQEWLPCHPEVRTEPTEDQLFQYFNELMWEASSEQLFQRIANEVFFLMFPNRRTLYELNHLISLNISSIVVQDLELEHRLAFSRDGMLKRCTIPEWVKTAVIYRDRGACARCNKDISGLVSISNVKHFDHIVPLAEGGINDVTNIQLLCKDCNLKMGKTPKGVSSCYERWYSIS